MRCFVKGWKTGGHEQRLEARIINYADDFVICCRGTAEEAMNAMRTMMSKLKLTVNEQKTRFCHLPEESFDFLGYTLGRNYDCRTGESYLGPRPAQKKVDRLCSAINELTTRRKAWRDVEDRELEVLGMLAAGRSNQEEPVATELVVTIDTVKKHVSHILDKLGTANRTEAVAQARVLGLIP